MKILAFETTDVIASVAIFTDGRILSRALDSQRRHAESVLAAAEELLRENNLSTIDMDAFAADVGPGSFTGVRIGVCLTNALALAHQKPAIAVNALEALAFPFFDRAVDVCALIDARNGNGYGAVYRQGSILVAPCACELKPFIETLSEDSLKTGTAADGAIPMAENVVRIAAGRKGEKQITPMYLKLSQAERMQAK